MQRAAPWAAYEEPARRLVRQVFRTTPRGAVEFSVVAAALIAAEPTPSSLIVGAVLSLLGLAGRLAAAGYGYNVGELTLAGPYRLVRHPYFGGSGLLFMGLCFAAGNAVVAGLAAFGLALIYRRSSLADEARLAQRLGPRFDAYRATVPAFLPQLVPAKAVPGVVQHFSLERALLRGRHREVDALAGLLIAFALLYAGYWAPVKVYYRLAVAALVVLYLVGRFIYYGAARKAKR